MNFFKHILTLASLCIFVGCVSPEFNYSPELESISAPPIDSINTVRVGDVMLREGKKIVTDAIYVESKVSTVLASFTLTPGYLVKIGETESHDYFNPFDDPKSGKVYRSAIADPFKCMAVDNKTGILYGVSGFNARVKMGEKNDYERCRYTMVTEDSFEKTLIYSGKVGNKIKIGYREFSNLKARPEYNNEVEYDLSESKVIAYKEARLEIINATKEGIKYKVVRNFNKTILP